MGALELRHVEAPHQEVATSAEPEPDRVALVHPEGTRGGGGDHGEGAIHAGPTVGERRAVAPLAHLVGHEADLPPVAAVVNAPEVDGAPVRARVPDRKVDVR